MSDGSSQRVIPDSVLKQRNEGLLIGSLKGDEQGKQASSLVNGSLELLSGGRITPHDVQTV